MVKVKCETRRRGLRAITEPGRATRHGVEIVTVLSMMKNTLKLTSLICGLLIFPAFTYGQSRPPSEMDPLTTRERPITEMEAEMKAKQAIKYAEKGHQETLDRAREIAEIGKELKAAVSDTPILDRESQKKIERLEKLTRKIRG